MEYTLIFDVTQSGFRHWWFPAFGLIFVVIGSVLVWYRRKSATRLRRFFPFVYLGFAIFWTLGAFAGTAAGYFSLASALRGGRCDVVTGEVTQFHPMPAAGHANESFVVGDRHFEYSDYTVSPGFNNTSSHGGPMREGLRVRIHYVGNDIARLEVAR